MKLKNLWRRGTVRVLSLIVLNENMSTAHRGFAHATRRVQCKTTSAHIMVLWWAPPAVHTWARGHKTNHCVFKWRILIVTRCSQVWEVLIFANTTWLLLLVSFFHKRILNVFEDLKEMVKLPMLLCFFVFYKLNKSWKFIKLKGIWGLLRWANMAAILSLSSEAKVNVKTSFFYW